MKRYFGLLICLLPLFCRAAGLNPTPFSTDVINTSPDAPAFRGKIGAVGNPLTGIVTLQGSNQFTGTLTVSNTFPVRDTNNIYVSLCDTANVNGHYRFSRNLIFDGFSSSIWTNDNGINGLILDADINIYDDFWVITNANSGEVIWTDDRSQSQGDYGGPSWNSSAATWFSGAWPGVANPAHVYWATNYQAAPYFVPSVSTPVVNASSVNATTLVTSGKVTVGGALTAGSIAASSSAVIYPTVTSSNFLVALDQITNGPPFALRLLEAAPTPPMVWSPFYDNANLNTNTFTETNLLAVARRWQTNGMLAAGWNIVERTDGWMMGQRDSAGRLVIRQPNFTNIAKFNATLHGMGFRSMGYLSMGVSGALFGGNSTCLLAFAGGGGGSDLSTIQIDIDQAAAWGDDFIFVDSCGDGYDSLHATNQLALFRATANSIQRTGKPMGLNYTTLSGQPGTVPLLSEVPSLLNIFPVSGTYDNVPDNYSNIVWAATYAYTNITTTNLYTFTRPGCYGTWGAAGLALSANTLQAYMSMAAISTMSPRIADYSATSSIKYFTNQEVTAVLRNGYCRYPTWTSNNLTEIWMKQLDCGTGVGFTNAFALVNFNNAVSNVTVNFSTFGLPNASTTAQLVRSCWGQTNVGTFTGTWTYAMPAGSVELFTVSTPPQADGSGYTNVSASAIKAGATIGAANASALTNMASLLISIEGDSNAALTNTDLPNTNTWADLVAASPLIQSIATTNVFNWAMPSDTASNMVSEYVTQAHTVAGNAANRKVFIMQAGVNDIQINLASSNLIIGYISNIWKSARSDGYKVMAMTITPATFASWTVSNPDWFNQVASINGWIVQATNQWDYLVRPDLLILTNGTVDLASGIHYNAASGAPKIAAAVVQALTSSQGGVTANGGFFNGSELYLSSGGLAPMSVGTYLPLIPSQNSFQNTFTWSANGDSGTDFQWNHSIPISALMTLGASGLTLNSGAFTGPATGLTNILRGIAIPQQFGATGDASTDDTVSLQKWLNWCSTNHYKAYLPPAPGGFYRITDSLWLTNGSGISIEGGGGQVHGNASILNGDGTISSGPISSIRIHQATTGKDGIVIANDATLSAPADSIHIVGICLSATNGVGELPKSNTSRGIAFDGGVADSDECMIENCGVRGFGAGLFIASASSLKVIGCSFSKNNDGIRLAPTVTAPIPVINSVDIDSCIMTYNFSNAVANYGSGVVHLRVHNSDLVAQTGIGRNLMVYSVGSIDALFEHINFERYADAPGMVFLSTNGSRNGSVEIRNSGVTSANLTANTYSIIASNMLSVGLYHVGLGATCTSNSLPIQEWDTVDGTPHVYALRDSLIECYMLNNVPTTNYLSDRSMISTPAASAPNYIGLGDWEFLTRWNGNNNSSQLKMKVEMNGVANAPSGVFDTDLLEFAREQYSGLSAASLNATNSGFLINSVPGSSQVTASWPGTLGTAYFGGGIETNRTPTTAWDVNAVEFINRAGITLSYEQAAVDYVCKSLKAANIWTNVGDICYLFLGGTSNSCAQNLFTNTWNLTWVSPVAANFGTNGVTGDGTMYGKTGVGLTGLTNYSLNSASMMFYTRSTSSTDFTTPMGLYANGPPRSLFQKNSTSFDAYLNTSSGAVANNLANVAGAVLMTRSNSAAIGTGNKSGITYAAQTSSSVPGGANFAVLARFDGGGTYDQMSTLNMRMMWIGGGLSTNQAVELCNISERFHAILTNGYAASPAWNLSASNVTATGTVSATGGVASSKNNKAAPTSISVTASEFLYTNVTSVNIQVFVDANGATTNVKMNGTAIFASLSNGDHTVILQPGDWIGVTYSVATPLMRYREF